ncbi:MAG: SH3 domain-containing protein, partial [Alkalibacterium sp.]|nr:SH3 domain-containing protein [Alkalibacterium sp.]
LDKATFYFGRILKGPWISVKTEAYVQKALDRIARIDDEAERQALYDASVNAKYTSVAWQKAVEGYNTYPNDDRFKEALELAAERNISYAEYLESKGDLDKATFYFGRILKGPWISAKTEAYVKSSLTRINEKVEEIKKDNLYLEIANENNPLKAWNKAVTVYSVYPNDNRSKDAINQTAMRMIALAKQTKEKGDAKKAEIYLNMILQGPGVSQETKLTVNEYLKWVNGPLDEAKRVKLYESVVNATGASEAWLKAIDGYKTYPDDDRFKEAIEIAAERNLGIAESYERRGKLEDALWYFNRVIRGPWLSEDTLAYATKKADDIKKIIDKDFIYEEALNAETLTERWTLAVEGYTNHSSDSRLEKLVQDTAIKILDQAFAKHKNQDFKAAAQLYDLLLNAPEIVATQTTIARKYVILADNHLKIDKATYHLSLYNHTLSEALNEQMKHSPKSDGAGRVHATRKQTEYYLNPKNFVSLNGVENGVTTLNGWVNASALNVRSGVGTNHSIVTTVIRNTKVKIVDFKDGWYNVLINIGDKTVKGWVSATYIQVEAKDSESKDLFEVFYPVATIKAGSLNVRQGPGVSYNRITSVSKNKAYRITDQQNGWYHIRISNSLSGWVSGDYVAVSKNINRSALQFLKLSGSSGISAADLNEELTGKGILEGTGESFRLASKYHNINEVYLMAHARHESGNGTSKLSTGVLVSEVDGVAVKPRVVYNMYGIYAFDNSALKSGSEYAYKQGWFTPEDAIIGGAKWISSRYINHETHQQDTLYKMRWNPAKPGVHQYATHIAWSEIQTSTLNTLVELSQKYNLNLHFDIPKYK